MSFQSCMCLASNDALFKPRKKRYKKSLRGCRNCKERKVKCDENRPSCRNCLKHRKCIQPCVFDHEPETVTSAAAPEYPQVPKPNFNSSENIIKTFRSAVIDMPPELRSVVGGKTLDPFMTYPSSSVSGVQMLMHHYLTSFVFRSFPADQRGNCAKTLFEDWWPEVCIDPLLFHVALLASALDLESLDDNKIGVRSKVLNRECISLLQQRLQDPILGTNDQSINAVILLAVIERERCNVRAATIHMSGLENMIRLRGGLRAVGSKNAMTACLVIWMSTIAMFDPLLSMEQFDCLGIPSCGETSIYLQTDRLSDFTDLGIHECMAAVFLEIRQRSENHLAASGDGPIAAPNALSTCISRTSLLQRLRHMNQLAEAGSSGTCITECCRLGVILYILSSDKTTYPDPTLLINTNMQRLKNSLETMIQFVGTKNLLLLWLLFVGGVSSVALPERKWFVGQLVVVVTDLNLMSWNVVKPCLMRFLWVDELCDNSFQGLWEDVISLIGDLELIKL